MPRTPHDSLFRFTFSEPRHAVGLIRSNLTPAIANKIDWATLELVPGSFVDEALSWRHSDLVFRANIEGHPALLYVLVEHQSRSDPLMAFRVLRYIMRIWESVLAADPSRSALPAVIPVVVHHGATPWNAARELVDLIELDAHLAGELRAYLPALRFVLDDLSGKTDAELRARPLTPLGLVTEWSLQNMPASPDPGRDLERIAAALAAAAREPRGQAALAAVMNYCMEVTEVEPERLHTLLETQLSRPIAETVMSTAERLRAEGREQGREQGRAEGEVMGEIKGRASVVLKLLNLRFGALPARTVERVESASIDELDRLAERVLSAKKLSDVWPRAKKKR